MSGPSSATPQGSHSESDSLEFATMVLDAWTDEMARD